MYGFLLVFFSNLQGREHIVAASRTAYYQQQSNRRRGEPVWWTIIFDAGYKPGHTQKLFFYINLVAVTLYIGLSALFHINYIIIVIYYAPPLIGGGIKRWCCLTSDVCLSVAYIGPKSRTERPRKTKIGTEVTGITCDSDTTFKVKRSKVKVTRPLYSAPC